MTTKQAAKVNAAYEAAALDLNEQIAKLQALVADLPSTETTQVYWGHVGSVSHLTDTVKQAIDHVESMIDHVESMNA